VDKTKIKMVRILSYQDMEDLISGATILGCGGGGNPETSKAMVTEVFEKGKNFSLLDPKVLRDDSWVCILGHVGGGIEQRERDLVKNLERVWKHPISIASKALANYLNIEFDAYLPSEIGAGNTVTPMYIAALEGKSTIDGDAAGGRAKPELIISTTHLLEIPITPLTIATHYGDLFILKKSMSDDRVESLCRYLSRISDGRVAVARCPTRGGQILKAIHPYSISLAINAGKTIREKKEDPVGALIKILNGAKRFEGYLESFYREERDGFMWGDIIIKGGKDFDGESFKIWFKNENLIGWRNGRVDITCPDAIIIVDSINGEGLYNWGNDFYRGREVTIIGMKSIEVWRSARGLEIFGPKHFGFDYSYKDNLNLDT
jgi:DUF917 family protein